MSKKIKGLIIVLVLLVALAALFLFWFLPAKKSLANIRIEKAFYKKTKNKPLITVKAKKEEGLTEFYVRAATMNSFIVTDFLTVNKLTREGKFVSLYEFDRKNDIGGPIALDFSNNIYIALADIDSSVEMAPPTNPRIVVISPKGKVIRQIQMPQDTYGFPRIANEHLFVGAFPFRTGLSNVRNYGKVSIFNLKGKLLKTIKTKGYAYYLDGNENIYAPYLKGGGLSIDKHDVKRNRKKTFNFKGNGETYFVLRGVDSKGYLYLFKRTKKLSKSFLYRFDQQNKTIRRVGNIKFGGLDLVIIGSSDKIYVLKTISYEPYVQKLYLLG